MTARLELRLGDKLARDLEEFAANSDTTKTEIIKRALALYSLARLEKEGGKRLYFREDGVEKELVAL